MCWSPGKSSGLDGLLCWGRRIKKDDVRVGTAQRGRSCLTATSLLSARCQFVHPALAESLSQFTGSLRVIPWQVSHRQGLRDQTKKSINKNAHSSEETLPFPSLLEEGCSSSPLCPSLPFFHVLLEDRHHVCEWTLVARPEQPRKLRLNLHGEQGLR